MGYTIRARLEDGKRRLEVLEARSGCVRMTWQADSDNVEGESAEVQLLRREADLHRLFRQLFVLAAGQELSREQGPSA